MLIQITDQMPTEMRRSAIAHNLEYLSPKAVAARKEQLSSQLRKMGEIAERALGKNIESDSSFKGDTHIKKYTANRGEFQLVVESSQSPLVSRLIRYTAQLLEKVDGEFKVTLEIGGLHGTPREWVDHADFAHDLFLEIEKRAKDIESETGNVALHGRYDGLVGSVLHKREGGVSPYEQQREWAEFSMAFTRGM